MMLACLPHANDDYLHIGKYFRDLSELCIISFEK